MSETKPVRKELIWKDAYSVGVTELDNQHKELFSIINHLIQTLNTTPNHQDITEIIDGIIKYKREHFATEDKYFHLFNYEGTLEHEAAHERFDIETREMFAKFANDPTVLAFTLVDFLEDWLIVHLKDMDQKYVDCFKKNGLH